MANGPLPHDVFSNDIGHKAEKSPIIFADSENIRIFAGQKKNQYDDKCIICTLSHQRQILV